MPVPSEGRLCFVVTRNHGSLIDTMLFLHGTELLKRSVLLLPPELHATHQTGLNADVREYRDFDDLIARIDAERPSAVFLFCGYLLTSTGLVSKSQVKQLVRHLRSRGIPTVTNDPMWGLLGSRLSMRSELPSRTLAQKVHKAFVEWLIPHRLRQSYHALHDLVHCYLAGVERAIPPEQLRTMAFFNTGLIGAWKSPDPAAGDGSGSSAATEEPYWLFILAALDYEIQVNLHGKAAFIDSLVARFREANDAGRRAVLIAPGDCLTAVKASAGLGNVELIGFCDYERYVSLLMQAEYAFYWNIGSSSNLYRVFNGLPVFYYDRGHVSRWFPAFYDRTVQLLYHGHTPRILDHRDPLVPQRLRALADEYRHAASDIVRQLKRLPEPQAMVAQLLDGQRSPQGGA
ncbi:MAG TPA: hypothetical protein VKH19_16505 [Gemmatimonadaceae bacterium]|nr:hypothetical protein [Gemmatimonadaceae bacterium]